MKMGAIMAIRAVRREKVNLISVIVMEIAVRKVMDVVEGVQNRNIVGAFLKIRVRQYREDGRGKGESQMVSQGSKGSLKKRDYSGPLEPWEAENIELKHKIKLI
jgi:hypothetical protein